MSALRTVLVAGCRPNFIKIAPLIAEMKQGDDFIPILVHTGQHYDRNMSDCFFRDLELPNPDVSLGVGSGSYAHQTAQLMQRLESALVELHPDLVIVVGDVNSTVAAALTSVTLGYPVAHVEAGLRSFDREMPEEINRVVTDAVSDLLFTTEAGAGENLLREGKAPDQIHFVGNVMIDSLIKNQDKIAQSTILPELGLTSGQYALLTLHRPSNVDDPESLREVMGALERIQNQIPIVFPVHPRTASRLEQFGGQRRLLSSPRFHVIEPLGYLDFINLQKHAAFVLTDSGGVQEETTALGIPCVTLRNNTERPVTVTQGTNYLAGNDPEQIVARAAEILQGKVRRGGTPDKWDGRAAERITQVLLDRADEIKSLYRSLRERTACLSALSLPSRS